MKKSLFLAALSGLAMVGCANIEQDIDQNPLSESLITFSSPVMVPNTRTVVGEMIGDTEAATNFYSTDESFKVYAVYTASNFATWTAGTTYMNGEEVKWKNTPATNGAWHPATNYYWPKEGYLTFAAYSPASLTTGVSYGATGLQITDFTVPANGYTAAQQGTNVADTQYDLMYADRAFDKVKSDNKDNHYNGVDLKFHHALSSVKFTVSTAENYKTDGYTIKVKSIKLNDILSQGTFNEGITSETAASTAAAWSGQKTKVGYTAFESTDGAEVTSTKQNVNTLKKDAVDDLADGMDFILLPQTLQETAIVTVVWTMQKNKGEVHGEVIEQTSKLKLKTEAVPAGKEALTQWEMGKRYVYNIVIGLDKIYFNPIVSDWVNEESLNTDLQ